MDIKKELGKKIKEKRLSFNLTQEELAERIGISPKSLSQIELGNNFVSAQNLEAICVALKTDPKNLFDFADNNNYKENYERTFQKLKENKLLLNKISRIIAIIE